MQYLSSQMYFKDVFFIHQFFKKNFKLSLFVKYFLTTKINKKKIKL